MKTLQQIKNKINDTKAVTMTDKHGEYIYNHDSIYFSNRQSAELEAEKRGYKLSEIKIRVAE